MSFDPTTPRRLGRSALEVTTLGFGAAPIGGFRATLPEGAAIAVVDEAWEQGVRLFDTSPFYGYGRSELRVGAALRDRPREEFVLSTKIGRTMRPLRPGESAPEGMRRGGLPGFDGGASRSSVPEQPGGGSSQQHRHPD